MNAFSGAFPGQALHLVFLLADLPYDFTVLNCVSALTPAAPVRSSYSLQAEDERMTNHSSYRNQSYFSAQIIFSKKIHPKYSVAD